MKCTIPEISWHNRDPVLSIDIQPVFTDETYRLASGGADCHVLIWHLKILNSGAVNLETVSDLTRHQRAVNVVRWSPSGQYLASGDDDANIIIWHLKTDNIPLLESESNDKEIWLINKILRGHKEDVYDLCWSPNGLKLVSGSIDNTAILWDISKGKTEHILSDHKGFVQGVAWDPKGQYIATLSSDRVCRIFDSSGKTVKSRTYKGILPVPESHPLAAKEVKYFHDDTFKSYFRRLSFSCDGNLLFLPSGCIDTDNSRTLHCTYVFTFDQLTHPAAILPSPKQITIVTRCCPVLFELHSDGLSPIINLPYRMVVAVATDHDVIIYDTQQLLPIAHFHRIHYTRITDLTWSADGQLLLAASTDGFCTFITFEKNELGIQYTKEDSEAEEIADVSINEETDISKTPKKPSFLKQWASKTPKTDKDLNRPKLIAVRREPQRAILVQIETSKPKVDKCETSSSRIQPGYNVNNCASAERVCTLENKLGNECRKGADKPSFLKQWTSRPNNDKAHNNPPKLIAVRREPRKAVFTKIETVTRVPKVDQKLGEIQQKSNKDQFIVNEVALSTNDLCTLKQTKLDTDCHKDTGLSNVIDLTEDSNSPKKINQQNCLDQWAVNTHKSDPVGKNRPKPIAVRREKRTILTEVPTKPKVIKTLMANSENELKSDTNRLNATYTDRFCTSEKNHLSIECIKDSKSIIDLPECKEPDNTKTTNKQSSLDQWALRTPKNYQIDKNQPKPIAVRREPNRRVLTQMKQIETIPKVIKKNEIICSENDLDLDESQLHVNVVSVE